jgi:hypothetical protein
VYLAPMRFEVFRRLMLGAAVLLGPLVAMPVRAGSDETSRDWRDTDWARFRQDMREAARRMSEASARERRDMARARRESRIRAEELRRDARELAADSRAQMTRLRTERRDSMRQSMREMRESIRSRCWRTRGRI